MSATFHHIPLASFRAWNGILLGLRPPEDVIARFNGWRQDYIGEALRWSILSNIHAANNKAAPSPQPPAPSLLNMLS